MHAFWCALLLVSLVFGAVFLHYSILLCKAELVTGLSSLHVLDLVREHPTTMRNLFVYTEPLPLTSSSLVPLLKQHFSPVGSNRRDSEELLLSTGLTSCNRLKVRKQYMHACAMVLPS